MTDHKKVIMNEDEYAAELKRLRAKADDLVAEYKALRKEIFYRLKFSGGGELTQDLKVRMARIDEIIDVDLERVRTEAIDVLGADVFEIDSELSKLEESLGGS
jgi:hypothetical protein